MTSGSDQPETAVPQTFHVTARWARSPPPPSSDPDDILNEDLDENRVLAGHVIEMYQRVEATLMSSLTDISKWVLTSLLAINGAAAVATWGIQMPPGYKVASSAAFVLGILAALLCGHIGVKLIGRAMRPIGEQIGYWITVQADGIRAEECEDFDAIDRVASKGNLLPTLIGWFSVVLFVFGIVIAGLGALTTSPVSIH